MKRVLSVLSLLLATACSPQQEGVFNGYIEGEYIYVSPTSGGLLQELSVARGDQVEKGQMLFALEATDLKASVASAQAEVEQARATWNDLTKGQRPEEIEIIQKQKEQAVANLENAKKEYDRAKPLAKIGGVSKSALDEKKAAFETTQARVQELTAQLATAMLGARDDKVEAAKAAIAVAEQKVVQEEKKLNESAPKAIASGKVEETYYRVGEYVSAGSPVVSLLPPENVKARFFMPQEKIAQIKVGQKIIIGCDGCRKAIHGKINYIASQTEFTPPVIYSVGSRDKLVFLVEATPDAFDPSLKPGLPIDIRLESP